jgi:wyosine [tRNA(Phe)-imidazoG37] synthetase (radical SAM superfamily)
MTGAPTIHPPTPSPAPPPAPLDEPRSYAGRRYVYVKFSPRARGLSVGVNLNPDKACNFDCVYCDVDRSHCPAPARVDLALLGQELRQTLAAVHEGGYEPQWNARRLPPELRQLRMVAISGEGEPTLCPQFLEAVETIVHIRARAGFPFFKIALLTNGSRLHLPEVRAGLDYLTREDEIWVKLDAGTAACFSRWNRPEQCRIEQIMANLIAVGRQRPVIIQSLFPLWQNEPPAAHEVEVYAGRLQELRDQGAQISLVQIYSVSRKPARPGAAHLPLRHLSHIARTVRQATGLRVEVF